LSLTYVIADIHGRADLLAAAVQLIDRHASGRCGTLITLGDYVDRGPNSREVIELLMGGSNPGWELVCLKGNHEVLMEEAANQEFAIRSWLSKGGGATLVSYGYEPGAASNLSIIPRAHLDWISARPLLYADRFRVYVHAGVDPRRDISDQPPETLLWKRYADEDARGLGRRHVVHGHTGLANGPVTTGARTNLDTLAWRTGRLTVGVFADDLPGGPVDLIEVTAYG
jgi:serine/threonine protein phosphatase 1